MRELVREGLVLAYHDRSDGGLFATVCEMAFAGRRGLDVSIATGRDPLAALFAEEPGAVLQIRRDDCAAVVTRFESAGLGNLLVRLGDVVDGDRIRIEQAGAELVNFARFDLHRIWSTVSYRRQAVRDNPATAEQAFAAGLETDDPGLSPLLTFPADENPAAPYINTGVRPSVAILREQGVNSHVEMAAAFDRAGFRAVDVHMTDILEDRDASERLFTASPPAAASPTAMFSVPAAAGRTPSCTTNAAEPPSAHFSSVTTPLLWVCAMAARCSPTSANSSAAAATGHGFCVIVPSSSKRVW